MVVAHPTLERTWSSLKSFDLQNIKLSKKKHFLKIQKKFISLRNSKKSRLILLLIKKKKENNWLKNEKNKLNFQAPVPISA